MTLAALQADFAAALRDHAPDAVPAGFSGAAARRFRIYRNNVRVTLIEALAMAYPAVARLVGTPFFERMANVYAAGHPAHARTLNLYGGEFADFIAGFAPARELPYLADTARLERAVLESLHAADAPALDPTALTALGADLATLRLAPHPATRLVRSEYPIADIWHANAGDEEPDADLVLTTGAAAALVVRPGFSVSVEALAPGQCAFAETLLAGGDPMTAHAEAASIDEDFDVIPAFRELLAAGAFAGLAGESREGEQA